MYVSGACLGCESSTHYARIKRVSIAFRGCISSVDQPDIRCTPWMCFACTSCVYQARITQLPRMFTMRASRASGVWHASFIHVSHTCRACLSGRFHGRSMCVSSGCRGCVSCANHACITRVSGACCECVSRTYYADTYVYHAHIMRMPWLLIKCLSWEYHARVRRMYCIYFKDVPCVFHGRVRRVSSARLGCEPRAYHA